MKEAFRTTDNLMEANRSGSGSGIALPKKLVK
jgi:hypothetical protein